MPAHELRPQERKSIETPGRRHSSLWPPKVELVGLPVDAFTPESLVDRLIADVSQGVGGYLMTPNLDNLRWVVHDDELMARANTADIRVADGMPLLWASRLQGRPLPARVAGSDLIFRIADAAARHHKSIYLLGGAPRTARLASEALRKQYGGLVVCGHECPRLGFEQDADEMSRITEALVEARPDFVLVGLPFPKASAVIAEFRQRLPGAWFLGLGVSFSFVCGDVRRAPRWMQVGGLEWLYRLGQEPRRLARRYLLEGPPFLLLLFRDALSARKQRLEDRDE